MTAEQPQRYRCVAPLIMVPSSASSGISDGVTHMVSVVEGGWLPADVDPDRIDHLVRHNLIEPVTDAGQ